jgi:hypothetical protein
VTLVLAIAINLCFLSLYGLGALAVMKGCER